MNQAGTIDLSFIPAAINEINRLLHEAAVAAREGDPKRERVALVRAGGEAMVALEELHDHPLWDGLRQERQHQLQQWQDLGLPVVDKLLVELGYMPPPPAKSLIGAGNTTLRLAVGLPDSQDADPITLAQQAIRKLEELIGELMKSVRSKAKLKDGLQRVCKALAGTLVAAIVIPEVQAGIREISPHAAELLRDLLRHAAHVLPSLSMVLVAGVVEEAHGIAREAQFEDLPKRTTGEDSIERTTVEGSERWRTRSMNPAYPATERVERERKGPDDIADSTAER